MNIGTLILIIAAVVVVLILARLITSLASHRMRSQKLKEKFGPEYDYTLEKLGDQRTAEETLAERERRVNQLDIHDLDENQRQRYQEEWRKIQADFVDAPSKSVEEANLLITEVMVARGFPVADFEQRAADLSVLYPDFVPNYRNAHAIALKNQSDGASTEDLRQAMVYYRSLFDELLGAAEVDEIVVKA